MLPQDLAKAHYGFYELFADGFEAYGLKVHSTGAVLLRSMDMNLEHRGKRDFSIALLLCPGPRQPKLSYAFMDVIANDFKQLSIDSAGIEVRNAIKWSDESKPSLVRCEPFVHKPILAGVDADFPMSQWIACALKSPAAFLACLMCKLCGCRVGSSSPSGCLCFIALLLLTSVSLNRRIPPSMAQKPRCSRGMLLLYVRQRVPGRAIRTRWGSKTIDGGIRKLSK